MRADEAAVAALDAGVVVPDRDQLGDVALLVRRRAARVGAVHRKGADRQLVAAAGHHLRGDGADELRGVRGHRRRQLARRRHAVGHLDLVEALQRPVDRRPVLLDHLRAALSVRLLDRLFDLGDRLVARQHAGDREEAGLEDDVDATGQAHLARDPGGVDGVDLDVLGEDLLLDGPRQRIPDLVRRVPAVEQQRGAGRRPPEHVDLIEQPELMAADEARVVHEVRRPDRLRPEAQVRHGLRAGLLRVVDEVRLGVQVLLPAQDLDRVLVRPDRPVRPEPEEDRADRVRRLDVQRRVVVEARLGDVVDDADGEPASRLLACELREHAGDHARRELLRRQPVAAAGHPRHDLALAVGVRLAEGGDDVEVERLAHRAGLLGAVQHADLPHRRGQRLDQRLRREGPVQPHLDHADLLVPLVERGHRLRDGLRTGAHHDQRPARPPGARCSRRCGAGGRCARRGGPSGPRPRRGAARRTGSPSRAPGSGRPGSARCRG